MRKNTFDNYVVHLRNDLRKTLQDLHPSLPLLSEKVDMLEIYATYGKNLSTLTPHQIAAYRLFHECGKKYVGGDSSVSKKVREQNCWEKFLVANETCDRQNHKVWSGFPHHVDYVLEHVRVHLQELYFRVLEKEKCPLVEDPRVWDGEFNWLFPVDGFSTGPGSVKGVQGISTFEKYRGSWEVSSARGMNLLQRLRRWNQALHDLPNFQCSVSTTTKMGYVPKDFDIDRGVIPQLNGDLYLQYPVAQFLEEMLNFDGINLSKQQDIHKEMARKGSLYDNLDVMDRHLQRRGPRYCTIDLVSASDIIGVDLVRTISPAPLFNYMDSCRSPGLEGPDESVVSLNMMANMGNAFCFPLQTLVFSSIIRAVYWRLGIPLRTKTGELTYSVYGDDIIVDVAAYREVVSVLEGLEMIPNKKKSFAYGYFRESCGGDFLNGVNIRPVYCETLDSDANLYSLANRLAEWSAYHSVDLTSTITFLLSETKHRVVVPMDYGAHMGLRLPGHLLPLLPREWNNVRVSVSTYFEYTPFYAAEPLQRRYLRTQYPRYDFGAIVVKGRKKRVRYSKTEGGTLMFAILRGGLSQSSKKDDRTLVIPERETQELRAEQTTSLWDVPNMDYRGPAWEFLDVLEPVYGALLRVVLVLRASFAHAE